MIEIPNYVANALLNGSNALKTYKYMDIIPPHHYAITRWLLSLPTFGWEQDGFAYLIVPDWHQPHRTRILKEALR